MANNFLVKLRYYISIYEHVKHAHQPGYSDRCDHIAKITKKHMLWCENTCVFATKTFKPFSLKDMSAFVHMISTRKFHMHDLHVEKPGIMINSISDAMNFFKMGSKPIRQLCSCRSCNKPILQPHYCNICRDFETFQYLYTNHPTVLSTIAKCHMDQISILIYGGKFLEKPEFEPPTDRGFNQLIITYPFRAGGNCAGEGDECQSITYDDYIERFPSPDRYRWLEESYLEYGDVELNGRWF